MNIYTNFIMKCVCQRDIETIHTAQDLTTESLSLSLSLSHVHVCIQTGFQPYVNSMWLNKC